MACHGIELTLQNGKTFCIPMYAEVDVWTNPNPPDPPDPWLRVLDDLRIISTINQGVAQISDEKARGALAQSVQHTLKALTLPAGVKIGDSFLQVRHQAASGL